MFLTDQSKALRTFMLLGWHFKSLCFLPCLFRSCLKHLPYFEISLPFPKMNCGISDQRIFLSPSISTDRWSPFPFLFCPSQEFQPLGLLQSQGSSVVKQTWFPCVWRYLEMVALRKYFFKREEDEDLINGAPSCFNSTWATVSRKWRTE